MVEDIVWLNDSEFQIKAAFSNFSTQKWVRMGLFLKKPLHLTLSKVVF